MKKMLKRIFALMCIMTLVAATPATALANTPDYVYEWEYYNSAYKYFSYENNPIIINPGYSNLLRNNDYEGYYYAEAGDKLHFHVNFVLPGEFRFIVYQIGGSTVLYETFYTYGMSLGVNINSTGLYGLIVAPVGSTSAIIDWYNYARN